MTGEADFPFPAREAVFCHSQQRAQRMILTNTCLSVLSSCAYLRCRGTQVTGYAHYAEAHCAGASGMTFQ